TFPAGLCPYAVYWFAAQAVGARGRRLADLAFADWHPPHDQVAGQTGMLLGIVSDTHGFLHPALARAFADVDLVLHAGDIGTLEVLEAIEEIAPVHAVFGNVDGGELRKRLPEVLEAEFGGLRVLMMHIAGHPGRFGPSARAEIE